MEEKNKTFHRKKTVWAFVICLAVFVALTGRLVYLMVYQSAYYTQAAEELHQRERNIKAKRGRIIDATVQCWRITEPYATFPLSITR